MEKNIEGPDESGQYFFECDPIPLQLQPYQEAAIRNWTGRVRIRSTLANDGTVYLVDSIIFEPPP